MLAPGKDSLREPEALPRDQFLLPVWGCQQHCGITQGGIHGAPGSREALPAVKIKEIILSNL